MSNEKILTLSELAEFCMQNKIQTFSAKEYGRPIACRFESTMTFEDDDESDDESDLGLMHVSVKTSQLEKNRNGSFIPEKSGKVYLCGCKHTKKPPYCDGTHTSLVED